jgi:hypothetical protein
MVKAALRAEEPVQFKGALQIRLFEGKGSKLQCDRFRGIFVADPLPKAYRRFLRGRAADNYAAYSSDAQCGGIRLRATDLAAHSTRLFLDFAWQRKKPVGVLFADVISAFYSVLRQLVLPVNTTDVDFAKLLHSLKVPPESLQQLQQFLKEGTLVNRAGVDPHLAALLADAFSGKWFSTNGPDKVVQSARGSCPGDPLADMIFGFCAAHIAHDVNSKLIAADLVHCLDWDGTTYLFPVDRNVQQVHAMYSAFVDDSNYNVMAKDAGEFLSGR